MTDDVDYVFHAQLLAKNPALPKAFADLREEYARDRDRLALDAVNERWAVTVAESVLTKLERRLAKMTETGRIEQFKGATS